MQNRENTSRHTIKNILSGDFVLGFLALFAFANASFVLVPTLPIYLARLGSNETQIGIIGTFRALMDLGSALGPVIMGIIIPLTSYRIMFLSLALTSFITLCYFQFYVRKKRMYSLRRGGLS